MKLDLNESRPLGKPGYTRTNCSDWTSCSDIDEDDFEVRRSDPHGFDDDNDGMGCEEDDSTTSLEEEYQNQKKNLNLNSNDY